MPTFKLRPGVTLSACTFQYPPLGGTYDVKAALDGGLFAQTNGLTDNFATRFADRRTRRRTTSGSLTETNDGAVQRLRELTIDKFGTRLLIESGGGVLGDNFETRFADRAYRRR